MERIKCGGYRVTEVKSRYSLAHGRRKGGGLQQANLIHYLDIFEPGANALEPLDLHTMREGLHLAELVLAMGQSLAQSKLPLLRPAQ